MRSFLVLVLVVLTAIVPSSLAFRTIGTVKQNICRVQLNPTASGFATTREGKTKILERTKELIDKSALIIAIPAKGITKEQVDFFRKELPAGVTASVVKNSLMRIAVKETPFEKLSEHVAEQNMFMFIPEGEAKPAYAAYKKFQKEFKKTDPVHDPRNAIMEGQMYFDKNVEAVSNLPTKLELITKIAIGIKTVPTKVGRGVNAVPNKLGRAFALLRDKLEEEGK